jgi:hypothetical protein
MFCVSRGQSPTIINPFPNKHRLTPTARPLPAVAQRQPHVKPSHRTHKRGAWLFEAVRISDGLHRVPACLTYHLRTVVRDGWRRKLLGDGLKLQRDPFQLALSSGGRYVCRMHQRAPCFDCVQRLCEPRHASHTPSSDDRRTTPGHAHGLPVAHAHARAGRGVASRGILCHASCALPRVAGDCGSCSRFTHRWLSRSWSTSPRSAPRWDSCLLAPLPWVLDELRCEECLYWALISTWGAGTVHHLRVETGPVCGGGTGHDPVMFDSRTLLETVGGERDRWEWVLDLSQADDAYLPLSFEPSLPASRVRRKICEGQAAEQADGPNGTSTST